MLIDRESCIGCGACPSYCPVGAIKLIESTGDVLAEVDQDECVECNVCLRAGVCPTGALSMPELEWPRSLRAEFSNPFATHRSVNEEGRGTEEMKTNDVTGRFSRGFSGVMVEMGRPGIGASFRDLDIVSRVLASIGVQFEPSNPVTALMKDSKTGEIAGEVLNEKVLSAIIEFRIENERLLDALNTLREVAQRISTVFSLSVATRVSENGSIPTVAIAEKAGFTPRQNTKTNVGLGRPLKEDR